MEYKVGKIKQINEDEKVTEGFRLVRVTDEGEEPVTPDILPTRKAVESLAQKLNIKIGK